MQTRFKITHLSLLENSIVEPAESKDAEVFNIYFVNITQSLDVAKVYEQEPLDDHMDDTSLAIVERFRTHSSIPNIKSSVDSTINISLRKITTEEMLLQLQNLNPKKGIPQEAIPLKILQFNADMFCFHLR